MKPLFTFLIFLFCIAITAQDKIYVHTATTTNSSGNITYIDHPDLNGNSSAGIVISHVWNPGGSGGVYNNNVTGLWYNNGIARWAIYNEDTSAMIIGSSYNVYIANPSNVLTHIVTAANSPVPTVTRIDDARFNNLNPGPYAVMSNYYNPNGVYNNQNYGFWYATGINQRTIIEEGSNTIPLGAAFKILINGSGSGVLQFSHLTVSGGFGDNITGNYTTLFHSSLNNNPNATFVFSHYYGSYGTSSNVYLDKVLGVWYNSSTGRWNIYTEDSSAMPADIAFDIIIAPNDNLTYVPDDNFEQALIDLGYDTFLDDYVPTANINTVTNLNVSNENIADLTGIEDFVALNELYCDNNLLTNLDVSANTALTTLHSGSNQLSTLDVSTNTALNELYCDNNLLTNLDVSANTALTFLWCYNNQLTSLNVKNGNNTAINNSWFDATSNPNLTCIEVDNPAWSTTNWTNIDPQSFFATDCNFTYVPDDNFEQALIILGYDTVLDDYVLTANINTLTYLNVSNENIADLTGIEDFVALEVLDCRDNQLTSLDVTQNTALDTLICYTNQLTSLDVTQNTLLNVLGCSQNQLTSLDITQNTALTELYCDSNQLSVLDISLNTDLTALWCDDNLLTNLDVSTNTVLSILYCANNQLTNLDLTLNINLEHLLCNNNQLTDLNLKNGNNALIVQYDSTNNPSLNCIEVDDAAYSTTNWTNIDPQSFFSTDCSLTYVPDDNFEQALIDLGYDTVLDDYVITGNINTLTYLDVSFENIADLTGIEDFDALQVLVCNNNQLTSLDVTQNVDLAGLITYNNLLTSLDVSQNLLLDEFGCSNNQLTSLDVSSNMLLGTLFCDNNQITDLDLSLNTALTRLRVYNNQLTNLNVKNGNNTSITNFNSTVNPNLTCIEVDNTAWSTTNWTNIDPASSFNDNCYYFQTYVPDDNFEQALINLGYDTVLDDYVLTANIDTLTFLNVSSQSILDLTGIEDFAALETLYCFSNQLTSIDISQNTALTTLWCNNNLLTSIDVSLNMALTELVCASNQLTSLDLTQNTALTYLDCEINQITDLDLSLNTALTYLNCRFNQLIRLDVKNGNNLNVTYFNAMVNPPLACIEVDDAAYSTATWTNITAPVSFNENCYTYVPDNNFEQALIDYGYDTILDDYVLTANINTVTLLNVSGRSIADLTGIEGFVVLEELLCSSNLLTSLDITQNTALIDVRCYNNQLSSLDITQNTALTYLACGSNQLTDLNVTQNTALTYLSCRFNQLTSLDVSLNTALTTLSCRDNIITNLDVSLNTALTYLRCENNQLTSLDVRNGNNTNVTYFNAMVNPPLTCIEVDDAAYSTANWTNIDSWASFNENCALSVSELGLENQISIYPNPTTNELRVKGLQEDSQLEIYNLNGVLVLEQRNYTGMPVDISNLSSSVYFVKISNNSGACVKRLIIE